jgi:hypothetical protein
LVARFERQVARNVVEAELCVPELALASLGC